MRKLNAGIFAAMLLAMFACQLEAQETRKQKAEAFWSRFHLVKQRNAAWPQPFLKQDQLNYRAVFAPMIDSGWQSQCTLSDVHFTADGTKLNKAGLAKMANILSTFPADQRNLFVSQTRNKSLTTERVSAVKSTLNRWSVSPALVSVRTTRHRPIYLPGSYVEGVLGAAAESRKPPTIDSTGGAGVAQAASQ